MREVAVEIVAAALVEAIARASFELGGEEKAALARALESETSPTGRSILAQILENAQVACDERRPLCQDTGVAVLFVEVGEEVRLVTSHLSGLSGLSPSAPPSEDERAQKATAETRATSAHPAGLPAEEAREQGAPGCLERALQGAVREAYGRNYLRKSIVAHPLDRRNTGDNAPAIIHTRIVAGDRVRVRFAAKGGGCENMSRLAMLTPSAGRDGVVDFVVRTVCEAGGNPCPPVIVGVGLGGNFEKAALLAKEALLRPLGQPAERADDAELERELLERINATGVGPMGLGGSTTALAVHVVSHPCHIASLPVAVNLDCHSHRHAEVEL
jgi:fumarate hydratase subunit alpha